MVNFTKVSGVVLVSQDGGLAKSYFGQTGRFEPFQSNDGYTIWLGGTSYSVPLNRLQVRGQTPTTMLEGQTLLNAFFGT